MSIRVEKITKVYGSQTVLNEVSFSLKKGEIVGLLGPNGAGKSTLMKIITCYIPPSSGQAFVNDFNVALNPIEVKQCIGYLPENNPLYTDMYIKEYLEFIAGIHRLEGHAAKRVAKMIELTGLGPEQHKKIGTLSKGYRQRVGLAQALIHDPEVLILDEPTSGLDPNQLLEIRNLIREIGKEKTVILSTHIMQEVEAICGRAIIIHQGNIVADDSTAHLSSFRSSDVITVEFGSPVNEKLLRSIPGVTGCEKTGQHAYRLQARPGDDIRGAINKFAVDQDLTILSLHRNEQKLEDVFQQLTKI